MDKKIEIDDYDADGNVVGSHTKEVSEGAIARALLDGKSVLIATDEVSWARRVHQAWMTEIYDNPISGVDAYPDHEKLHTAFTNGAVLQIMVIANSDDLAKLQGVKFDIIHPVKMNAATAQMVRDFARKQGDGRARE